MTKINNKNKKINFHKIKSYLKIKSSFKNVFSSKIFIAVFFALLGVYVAVLSQNVILAKSQKNYYQIPKSQFVSEFEDHTNLLSHELTNYDRFFAEFDNQIQEIRQDFDRAFAKQNDLFARSFKEFATSSHKSSSSTSFEKSQDKKFLIYKLNFKGYNKDDIEVSVNNNILKISANKKQEKVQNKGEKALSKKISENNFYYSFYLPKNIDINPDIKRTDNEILVKFKKLNIEK